MVKKETNKKIVRDYLVSEPRFRERSAKNRGIADLLIQKHKLNIDRWVLSDIISDASSMDRAWRKILEEEKELRGSDYEDKEALEDQFKLEL